MKQHKKALALWIGVTLILLIAAVLAGSPGRSESVQETMRDAVLHNINRISLFGLKEVNPGLISAFLVTAFLLLVAALIRVLVIPRFRYIPGKFQLVLEEVVGLFANMAKGSSPHRNGFVGAYIFAAGAYIFVGTLFELLGVQAVTTHGGYQRGHRPGVSELLRHPLRRNCRKRAAGRGQDTEGILPAHLHELPAVWRASQRPAGDGIGLLLC